MANEAYRAVTAQDLIKMYNLDALITDRKQTKATNEKIHALEETSNSLKDFAEEVEKQIEDLEKIADGKITTYYHSGVPTLTNFPTNEWALDEYENHIGDLYYDKDTGYAYKFLFDNETNEYLWRQETNPELVEALAKANNALEIANGAQNTATNAKNTADNAQSVASQAQSTANNAQSSADKAQQTADNAQTSANNAQSTAENAQTIANNAKDSADSAQSTANQAQETAQGAQNLANTANNTANTAKDTADTAKSTAESAQSTAEGAQNTANSAQNLANTANNTANSANETATNAQTSANTANETANSAKEIANSAQESAESAQGVANSAQTTANSAQQTANQAQTTAGQKMQVFIQTPYPPYQVGDLWLKDDKVIYRCRATKTEGEYDSNDWKLGTDFTNDDYAKNVEEQLNVYKEVVATDYVLTTSFEETKQGFEAQVKSNTTLIEEAYATLDGKFADYAPKTTTTEIEKSVKQIQTDTYTKTDVQKIVTGSFFDDEGNEVKVTKVETTSGKFDEDGMHYAKTDAPTNSTINEKGLTVEEGTESGANAKDLLYAGYVDADKIAENQGLKDFEGQSVVYTENTVVNNFFSFGGVSRLQKYSEEVDGSVRNGAGFFYIGE